MNTSPVHRILIIDDNPSIHEDIRKILGARSPETQALEELESELFECSPNQRPSMEVEVVSALQGAEGLSRIEEALALGRPYSLAFVDMRMPPGWDGIETIQHLWEKDPRLQVVLCTAYSDYTWEDIVSRLRYSENLVILKKPFDNIELLQLAHALTGKWQLANRAPDAPRHPAGLSADSGSNESALLAEAFRHLPGPVCIRKVDSQSPIYANPGYLALERTGVCPTSVGGFRSSASSPVLSQGDTPEWTSVEFVWQESTYVLTTAGARSAVSAPRTSP